MMRTRSGSYERDRRPVMLLWAVMSVVLPALSPGSVAGHDVKHAEIRQTENRADRAEPVTIRVTNNNWLDMRVYAVVRGRRWRVGTAYTGQAFVVELPAHLQADIHPLQLVAFAIGGSGAASTRELLVSPGDLVDWVLENHLPLSSVFIR